MKIVMLLFMFFCIAGLMIIHNNGLALYSEENRGLFFNLYAGWLDDIYSNSADITGKVVDLEWLPKR